MILMCCPYGYRTLTQHARGSDATADAARVPPPPPLTAPSARARGAARARAGAKCTRAPQRDKEFPTHTHLLHLGSADDDTAREILGKSMCGCGVAYQFRFTLRPAGAAFRFPFTLRL